MKFLELPDIVQATCVCKCWNQLFSDQDLWKYLFKKEGIPLVSSTDGTERNYKKDFNELYPITLSGKIISQFIGEVVEEIPPISEGIFNELQRPDPYETEKLKKQTFIFVVSPSFVMRTVDQKTPLALNQLGNLIESSKQESEQTLANTTKKSKLHSPLSLKNIKVLCSYPLKRKENRPVFFDKYSNNDAIFTQCDTRPDIITVYFMRRNVIEKSKGMSYNEQQRLVKDKGFEVTPLRVRVLFDVVGILKDGTCPEARAPQLSYSCHPETVLFNNYIFHLAVGGFTLLGGLQVIPQLGNSTEFGVVPGVPAEVPTIDKGN
jgi:hypothetical protein